MIEEIQTPTLGKEMSLYMKSDPTFNIGGITHFSH